MVRRTDRPLGQVRVSFETTRLGLQHLIDAYELLVPEYGTAPTGTAQQGGAARGEDNKSKDAKR